MPASTQVTISRALPTSKGPGFVLTRVYPRVILKCGWLVHNWLWSKGWLCCLFMQALRTTPVGIVCFDWWKFQFSWRTYSQRCVHMTYVYELLLGSFKTKGVVKSQWSSLQKTVVGYTRYRHLVSSHGDVLLQILLGGNGAVATNTIEGIRRLRKSCGHRSFVKLCETPNQARKALWNARSIQGI